MSGSSGHFALQMGEDRGPVNFRMHNPRDHQSRVWQNLQHARCGGLTVVNFISHLTHSKMFGADC